MSLLLTAILPDQSNRSIALMVGQSVQVGTSPWNSFSIPEDRHLMDVHFEVLTSPEHVIRSTDAAPGLVFREQTVRNIELKGQTRVEFLAGETRFIAVHQCVHPSTRPDKVVHTTSTSAKTGCDDNWIDLLRQVNVHCEDCERVLSSGGFLKSLAAIRDLNHGDHLMALMLRLLPPQVCLSWLEDHFKHSGVTDTALWTVLSQWASNPEEQKRLAVIQFAQQNEMDGIGKYLTESVRFSGGSLSLPDLPVVSPPEHLSGLMLLTAFNLSRIGRPGIELRRIVDQGISLVQAWYQQQECR